MVFASCGKRKTGGWGVRGSPKDVSYDLVCLDCGVGGGGGDGGSSGDVVLVVELVLVVLVVESVGGAHHFCTHPGIMPEKGRGRRGVGDRQRLELR